MATAFEQIFGNGQGGAQGLLGNPAFMVGSGLLSNQGNPWGGAIQGLAAAQGYKLSESKMKKDEEKEKRLSEMQAIQMKALQDAQARQEYTKALLAAGSSQSPGLLQDPTYQAQLRQKAAAYGDPAALEQGGLLAPMPTAPKSTSLITNLQAMGIDPQSEQGRAIMMQSLVKPQTSVNVNTGLPKPPAGQMWRGDDPTLGLMNIPGGPQDLEEQKKAAAKGGVTQMVGDIAKQYDTLKTGGGITSTANDVTSNLLASASKSGIGQAAGGAAGTTNQAARDSITIKRPLLIQAIKNATGMSAQQMNSNAELQQMINMATNPDFGYEVNQQQLKLIDSLYGSGTFGQSQGGASNNGFRIVE